MYSIKETPAAVQRLAKLNLDKSGTKELLSTNEGRKSIGYNYLNAYNPPEEISYSGVKKSGKRIFIASFFWAMHWAVNLFNFVLFKYAL